ncbi:enoyl-CoA hydratase-related protein [Riemerella anatipestifer]|uniref:enoyl-CoA hydratase/isomerase family protein n=1 Tax=Riemerella anatipestifer TaxID=34085 RepID=UPI00286790D5|nr:enoyl-CoA hydratase-related protein [Riemerella anatipestifer]MDR7846022.1 enoyl-CoA hydratase-related protein [Riemerella anatipestifer]MDY3488709.1 enoyl-CoA hydratase-related protein [Riemerella anatipestifer]
MYKLIDVDNHFEGKLQIAYINQPESFNSLNKVVLEELLHFIKACDADSSVRCIAISGKGKAFCSGQNLKEALDYKAEANEERFIQRIVIDYYNPLVKAIVYAKKPVIALVNGPAVGAGAMLALICDFAVASESAYFSLAFSNIGLVPDTAGTYYLPKLLGRSLASYLAFTGKKLSAKESLERGLVADVFSDVTFSEQSLQVLEHITHQPTVALGLTKKAFNKSYQNSLSEQLDLESILQQDAAETWDFQEGIAAFLAKRKPQYKGK